MSSDFSFAYVAGVHPVAPVDKSSLAQGDHRRDLLSGGERSWDILPEYDLPDDVSNWRHSGEPINLLLQNHLRTLQDRCTDEAIRNPAVEGVIQKHITDIVGESGPTLQVETEGWSNDDEAEEYREKAEALWKEVAEAPTADGEDSISDLLAQAINAYWTTGGTVDRIIVDPDVDHPITIRLLPIEIQRLENPAHLFNDVDTLLGIRRNQYGRPQRYFFQDKDTLGTYFSTRYAEVKADAVIHFYNRRMTGQVRGIPALASPLPTIKDLRQFDRDVMDVVTSAAMLGVLMYTTSDMAEVASKSDLETPVKLKRRGITRLPSHYQPQTVESNQPIPQYRDFRHERMRDLGRPAAMPQLAVQMDASGHNYSSARFDDRAYWRANKAIQNMLGRKKLSPYAKLVLRQGESLGLLPRRRGAVKLFWQWTDTEGIDPVKEAMARRIRMQNGTLSPQDAAREENTDFEMVCKMRARAIEVLKKYNLPLQLAETILDPAMLAAEIQGTPGP